MRIAICDDDTLFIEQLTDCVQDFFHKSNLALPDILTFTSGEALLADPSAKDIVFWDIEMPRVSGIYTGNELKKKNRQKQDLDMDTDLKSSTESSGHMTARCSAIMQKKATLITPL